MTELQFLVSEISKFSLSSDDLIEITSTDLHLGHCILFSKSLSDRLFTYFEANIEYMKPEETEVKIFGKSYKIPRKQAAFGDERINYKFSGTRVDAKLWDPVLEAIRNVLERCFGLKYNFVLINRYADGNDRIGEHKDDEKDLEAETPIASLSLGQARDFVLRHESARKRKSDRTAVSPSNVRMNLKNGQLLLMRPPTNKHWYHSVPQRKRIVNPRINLTFRKMI